PRSRLRPPFGGTCPKSVDVRPPGRHTCPKFRGRTPGETPSSNRAPFAAALGSMSGGDFAEALLEVFVDRGVGLPGRLLLRGRFGGRGELVQRRVEPNSDLGHVL